MDLISKIINELMDSEKSLLGPLLKTKVLAKRIKNTDLLYWVSREISGYKDDDEIPYYRKDLSSLLMGTYRDARIKYSNVSIPTLGIDENLRYSLEHTVFYDSINSLEDFIKDESQKIFQQPLRTEVLWVLTHNWRKASKNSFIEIVGADKVISRNIIIDIVNHIRNILLDFMLKLEDEFGEFSKIEDLKNKPEEIIKIMNQTIITTKGDRNIINTGNHSQIDANIYINKGNKEQLSTLLKEKGVENKDVDELLKIIDDDSPNIEQKTFGKKVNSWISSMVTKALDGTWSIGFNIAATVLHNLISSYYGF